MDHIGYLYDPCSILPLKYFFFFSYLIRLMDSTIAYVRNLFMPHLVNSIINCY